MRKYFILLIILNSIIIAQQDSIDFRSPENIKKFGDYLFCQGDYLRAVEEYKSVQNILRNDTVNFKMMLCYSNLGLYETSNDLYKETSWVSPFHNDIELLKIKNKLLEMPRSIQVFYDVPMDSVFSIGISKLNMTSRLYGEDIRISKSQFLSPFDEKENKAAASLYDLKTNPPYKSPALAGIMSAIIPGTGKMYSGEWADGITSFIVTGLMAFLAYDNFHAGHNTRGWIFTTLGTFFYGGNVYGSIAAAQIFNAKINFDIQDGIKLFLDHNNYFLPDYDFCK